MQYPLSVAPMLNLTNRYCRYLHRLLNRDVLLYTEMVVCGALLYGDAAKILGFNSVEHPLALQLAGNNPQELAECAQIGVNFGYDEINLNVGCPSPRVQQGGFGAALFLDPKLTARCVAAMSRGVKVPVTVKTRISVKDGGSLAELICRLSDVGCRTVIVHAREARLNRNTKENRTVTPRYDLVYQLQQDFPELNIVLNGGITSKAEIAYHLQYVSGVMIGRAAYYNPYELLAAEDITREEVVAAYVVYIKEQLELGVKLTSLIKPILGLYHGQKGAKTWRRNLSENGRMIIPR